MAQMMTFASALLDLLFPPRCAGCGRTGAVLCARCFAAIQSPTTPLCPRCGRQLSAAATTGVCAACAAGHDPRHLDAARACAAYDGPLRNAVLALKFRGQRRVAQPLGRLLASEVRRAGWQPDVVVPVPLHRDRRRTRGYNQAELLARACARSLGLPCSTALLVRSRVTRPQVGLSTADRRANVAGAFALAGPRDFTRLAGRRVLLVDDVLTTGSTLDAAAEAVRAAGPATVWGLAVARPDLGTHNADPVETPTPTRRQGKALP